MTPDTNNYMLLGYAVVAIILIASMMYLVLKRRNLQAELHTLEAIEEDDRKSAVTSAGMTGNETPAKPQTPAIHPR